MASDRSSSVSISLEKVDAATFGDLFKYTRKSDLPAYVSQLSGYKVGDMGMFAFTTDDDRKTKESFLRRAASELGLGISLKPAPGGKHIAFQIKSRVVRKRKSADENGE